MMSLMAKSNRLPRRVRLGAVLIRFPEAHFSWAPQGMVFYVLGLWLFVFFFTPNLLGHCRCTTFFPSVSPTPFWFFFPPHRDWDKLFVSFFAENCVPLFLFFLLFGGRGGRSLYCLLVFYPFRYEGIDHTRDKIHC